MSVTLSNLTMSNVSAGTSGSTPPAGDPYWSSVSLLTETTSTNTQANLEFLDSSINNFTITNTNGGYTQGTFSPVSGGHSAHAGGNFCRLDLANFTYATGNFTIEAWVYPTETNTNMTIFAQSNANNLNTGAFRIESDNALTYTYYTDSGGGSAVAFQGGTISPNVWTHVAVSRSGTTTKLFVNGTVVNTATIATMYQSASGSAVGSYATTNVSPFYGYLSDVRVTTAAVYTGNFSVPTAPLTAISGTQLLLSFDNAGIYDAAAKNNMFTAGNTQVSTAQAKFGTTSINLDGTGDTLYAAQPSSNFAFGTGDFTVEGWVYVSAATPTAGGVFQQGTTLFPADTVNSVAFGTVTAGQTWQIYAGNAPSTSATTWTTGTWYNFAVVRSSGTTKLYIDGVSVISLADTVNYTGTYMGMGAIYGAAPYNLNGYIQDFRVTKGVARYTANFTPSAQPFPTN